MNITDVQTDRPVTTAEIHARREVLGAELLRRGFEESSRSVNGVIYRHRAAQVAVELHGQPWGEAFALNADATDSRHEFDVRLRGFAPNALLLGLVDAALAA